MKELDHLVRRYDSNRASVFRRLLLEKATHLERGRNQSLEKIIEAMYSKDNLSSEDKSKILKLAKSSLDQFPKSKSSDSEHNADNTKVHIFEPKSYDEMPKILETLRLENIVILNVVELDTDKAQRAIDFMSSGCYGHGFKHQLGEGIFLFAPEIIPVIEPINTEGNDSSKNL